MRSSSSSISGGGVGGSQQWLVPSRDAPPAIIALVRFDLRVGPVLAWTYPGGFVEGEDDDDEEEEKRNTGDGEGLSTAPPLRTASHLCQQRQYKRQQQ